MLILVLNNYIYYVLFMSNERFYFISKNIVIKNK